MLPAGLDRSSPAPDGCDAMTEPLLLVLFVAGVLSVGFLLGGAVALRRVRWLAGMSRLGVAAVFLSLAAVAACVVAGTQGYRGLVREDVAAVVYTDPIGPQTFRARFEFADGTESSFLLQGDELYVDARILKWTPYANLLGLHTVYEIDRVAGRYRALEDERQRSRTVFSLVPERRVDLFALRKRFPQLQPFLDAEYGSATFATAREPAAYEVRVSTTGLLLRRLPEGTLRSARPALESRPSS